MLRSCVFGCRFINFIDFLRQAFGSIDFSLSISCPCATTCPLGSWLFPPLCRLGVRLPSTLCVLRWERGDGVEAGWSPRALPRQPPPGPGLLCVLPSWFHLLHLEIVQQSVRADAVLSRRQVPGPSCVSSTFPSKRLKRRQVRLQEQVVLAERGDTPGATFLSPHLVSASCSSPGRSRHCSHFTDDAGDAQRGESPALGPEAGHREALTLSSAGRPERAGSMVRHVPPAVRGQGRAPSAASEQ